MTTKKIYGPWIKWDGGECPVPPKTLVKIKLRSGHVTGPVFAAHCEWKRHNHHADIVEFCTITEQPDLEAAEQLLRANDYTIIPPAKPLTFEDDLRHQPPLMTATEINALPHKAREYIHQLEANTDPSGMVRENMQLLDTNKGLQIMYRNRTDELDRVKQALEPLTFEDVVPMTEAPQKGTEYWVASPSAKEGIYKARFVGDVFDDLKIKRRMAYLDKEHALVAAQHIFGLKGGEL